LSLALTGGKDGHLIVYDIKEESILVDIKAHTKPVIEVVFTNTATEEN
jgi:hypothetical protein